MTRHQSHSFINFLVTVNVKYDGPLLYTVYGNFNDVIGGKSQVFTTLKTIIDGAVVSGLGY